MTAKPFRVLSWGGGTQSTALGEMSAQGLLPRLDAILFSDLEAEQDRTYEIISFYTRRWRTLGIHVEMARPGSILKKGAKEHIHVPFFTATGAPLRRQCTKHFKIYPIRRRVRQLIGHHPSLPPNPPAGAIEQWIGYSWDEFHRIADSGVRFIKNRYPLIERKMTRQDSIDFLAQSGLPIPPLSACIICPYRRPSEWLRLAHQSPGDFNTACDFDTANRNNPLAQNGGGSTADQIYIYQKSIPLPQADLERDAAEQAKRQNDYWQPPLLLCTGADCWT